MSDVMHREWKDLNTW